MFFVPFCIVSCGAFVASFYLPRTYQATTSFEVRNDPIMLNLPMQAGATSYKYFRNTMVRDLTSPETMTEVVDQVGLLGEHDRNPDGSLSDEGQRRRISLARSLGASLEINTTSPSELMDAVRITYTGTDPAIGRRLVDTVKRNYINRTGVWIHDFLQKQRDYFQQEAQTAGNLVLRAQREETQLRMENPFVNPADPGAISARLAGLETERRELLLRRREYEAELGAQRQLLAANRPDKFESSVAGPPVEEFASPRTLAILAQIQSLNEKVQNLRQTRGMTDEHPDIRELLGGRSGLESDLDRQRQMDRECAVTGVDDAAAESLAERLHPTVWTGEEARVSVQVAALTHKIKEVDINLQANALATQQFSEAKDGVFEKQEEFAAVMAKIGKAKQAQGQFETTVAAIEPALKAVEQKRLVHFAEGLPARGGSTPVSPKASTIMVLSLLAGLAVGALFVVLAEVLDHVYRSSSQVARNLGLPILEAIDEIVTAQDRRRALVYRTVVLPLIIVLCLGFTGVTGSMAYLSLVQPTTYERLRKIPNVALEFFVDRPKVAETPDPSLEGP